jgi:hypothetical protein
MTLVLGLKLAAIKLHDFSVQSIDEFIKIYEKILSLCNNPDLLMIILDISEALIMRHSTNVMNIRVNLRIEKK